MVDITVVDLDKAVDTVMKDKLSRNPATAFAFSDLSRNITQILKGEEPTSRYGYYDEPLTPGDRNFALTAMVPQSKRELAKGLAALAEVDVPTAVERLNAVWNYVKSPAWMTESIHAPSQGWVKDITDAMGTAYQARAGRHVVAQGPQLAAREVGIDFIRQVNDALGRNNEGYAPASKAVGIGAFELG